MTRTKLKLLAVIFTCLLAVNGNAVTSTATTTVHSHIISHVPVWYQPLLSLHHSWLPAVHCLLHTESRSTFEHPNLGDNRTPAMGSNSGIFQMANYPGGVWNHYAMPTLHVQIWQATPYQQAEGFAIVVRIDGFYPWHKDGCIYPN